MSNVQKGYKKLNHLYAWKDLGKTQKVEMISDQKYLELVWTVRKSINKRGKYIKWRETEEQTESWSILIDQVSYLI